jgi:uncharacterized Zn finger protein
VAERRRRAAKKIAKLRNAGCDVSPIEIVGRRIAATFWGDAWCKNLEAYSDYSNRLPRGRTYVRNGSVIDLQIESGRVHSLVCGSDIYEVDIKIKSLAKLRWNDIKGQCAGQIDSLVELLRGSISKGVMEIVTRKGEGLFPAPKEISLSCSCPDWASMCKHVAATLYGVGVRLDHAPEMLFTLRGVDPDEMVEAAVDQPPTTGKPRVSRVLAADELSSVFGVDIEMTGVSEEEASQQTEPRQATEPTRRKTGSRASSKTKARPAKKRSVAGRPAKKAAAKRSATKPDREAALKKTPTRRSPVERKPVKKAVAKRKTSIARPAINGKAASKKVPRRKKTSAKEAMDISRSNG